MRKFATIREWLQFGIDWAEKNLTEKDLDCNRFHVMVGTPKHLADQKPPPTIEGAWKNGWKYFTQPLMGGWLIVWRKYA